MSDDILFREGPDWAVWSARSLTFHNLLQDIRKHFSDDPDIDRLLAVAQASGGLGICFINDENTRIKITRGILEVAHEWRQKIPKEQVNDIEWMTKLINLAKEYLNGPKADNL